MGVGEVEFGGTGITARVRLWCRGADPGACLEGVPLGEADPGPGFQAAARSSWLEWPPSMGQNEDGIVARTPAAMA